MISLNFNITTPILWKGIDELWAHHVPAGFVSGGWAGLLGF